jgi:hypothetical protein
MKTSGTIGNKQLDPMLIASVPLTGEHAQVSEHFESLHQQVGDLVCGKGMLLHHLFNPSGGPGNDVEVCYPISQPVTAEGISCRTLEGGSVLTAAYLGPIGARGQKGSITDAWRQIFDYVGQESVIVDAVPLREVFLESGQELQPDSPTTSIEIQLGYAFYRLERLVENLNRFAGEPVASQVMAGSETYHQLTYYERAIWFKGAMKRLDSLVDERTRRNIMISAGDRFPRERIQMLRDVYQRTGDLDQLLEIMAADRSLGDRSWYERPSRQGNVIYVTKDPVLPDEHAQAKTKEGKRAAYCHCRFLQEAIQAGITMSRTYCYCGAGWYDQLWSGIVGQPVRLETVESVLQGDDRCTFAIHLPDGELQET